MDRVCRARNDRNNERDRNKDCQRSRDRPRDSDRDCDSDRGRQYTLTQRPSKQFNIELNRQLIGGNPSQSTCAGIKNTKGVCSAKHSRF
jgi:hypothetical protein